jgi:hypothetical protein
MNCVNGTDWCHQCPTCPSARKDGILALVGMARVPNMALGTESRPPTEMALGTGKGTRH